MKNKFSIFQKAALVILAVSTLLSVIRINVVEKNIVVNSLNTGNGYFIERNTETVAFVIFSICFSVAFIFLGLFIGKKANGFLDIEDSPAVFSSALCGFMLMAIGFYYSYLILSKDNIDFSILALCVLMIGAAVMFLYMAISKNIDKLSKIPYMRIVVCVFTIVRLLIDFIKQNGLPFNLHEAYHIIGLLLFMLFMIYEGKNDIGNVSMRVYLIIGYLCVLFLPLYALPNLILTLKLYLSMDSYVLFSAVDIVLAFYVFTKVYSVTRTENENAE